MDNPNIKRLKETIEKLNIVGAIIPDYKIGRRMGLTDDETEKMVVGLLEDIEYFLDLLLQEVE